MNWGKIVRGVAVAIGTTFVVAVATYLALRSLAWLL